MIEVDREHIQLWVDALPSGKYPQTIGRLRRTVVTTGEKAYCCLGVACELAIADGVEVSVKESSVQNGLTSAFFDGATGTLPIEVQRWLGLQGDDPVIFSAWDQITAVDANDNLKWSFDQIAHALWVSYLADHEPVNAKVPLLKGEKMHYWWDARLHGCGVCDTHVAVECVVCHRVVDGQTDKELFELVKAFSFGIRD